MKRDLRYNLSHMGDHLVDALEGKNRSLDAIDREAISKVFMLSGLYALKVTILVIEYLYDATKYMSDLTMLTYRIEKNKIKRTSMEKKIGYEMLQNIKDDPSQAYNNDELKMLFDEYKMIVEHIQILSNNREERLGVLSGGYNQIKTRIDLKIEEVKQRPVKAEKGIKTEYKFAEKGDKVAEEDSRYVLKDQDFDDDDDDDDDDTSKRLNAFLEEREETNLLPKNSTTQEQESEIETDSELELTEDIEDKTIHLQKIEPKEEPNVELDENGKSTKVFSQLDDDLEEDISKETNHDMAELSLNEEDV